MKSNELLYKGFSSIVKKSPEKKSPLDVSTDSEKPNEIECCNANTMVTMPDGQAYYKQYSWVKIANDHNPNRSPNADSPQHNQDMSVELACAQAFIEVPREIAAEDRRL
jgi:hypothetical protein